MSVKPISLTPQRIFGPIGRGDAEAVAEMILDDDQTGIRDTLVRFMNDPYGTMSPRELVYEIQVLMDNHYARITASRGQVDDFEEHG